MRYRPQVGLIDAGHIEQEERGAIHITQAQRDSSPLCAVDGRRARPWRAPLAEDVGGQTTMEQRKNGLMGLRCSPDWNCRLPT
jgi:hypothetical protein